jgi:hypothetical protein
VEGSLLLKACKAESLQSSDGILDERQGCIPAPPAPAITYSCIATVLYLIVSHGFPLSRE